MRCHPVQKVSVVPVLWCGDEMVGILGVDWFFMERGCGTGGVCCMRCFSVCCMRCFSVCCLPFEGKRIHYMYITLSLWFKFLYDYCIFV